MPRSISTKLCHTLADTATNLSLSIYCQCAFIRVCCREMTRIDSVIYILCFLSAFDMSDEKDDGTTDGQKRKCINFLSCTSDVGAGSSSSAVISSNFQPKPDNLTFTPIYHRGQICRGEKVSRVRTSLSRSLYSVFTVWNNNKQFCRQTPVVLKVFHVKDP